MIDDRRSFKVGPSDVERAATVLNGMASAYRLHILVLLLGGEMTPQAIGEALSANRFFVARQLRGLRDVRLVRLDYRGRRIFYSLAGEQASRLVREIIAYGERRSRRVRRPPAGSGRGRDQPAPDVS